MKKFADEHKGKKIQDIWLDYKDPQYPEYPTQKNNEMLEMIIKQSSHEDSIVLDCFCGSGSTLFAAQNLKRKFIGVDESQIAINVATKKLTDFQLIHLSENYNQKFLNRKKKIYNCPLKYNKKG